MNEERPICPHCHSDLTVPLGQQWHCNACGREFGFDKNPISTAAAKRVRTRVTSGNRPQK